MKHKAWAGFIFFCLAVSPMLAVKKDTKIILDEIQKLSQMVQNLEKRFMLANADIGELSKKVEILGERISAMSNNQADMSQSKESILLNLQAFKEELGELKAKLSQILDRISGLNPISPASTPENPKPNTTTTTGPQENVNLYYQAYSDYIKENYDLAIQGFRQYLNTVPESGLSDNALYWIGECLYAKKKFPEAIATFSEVINKYKDGDKVPAALLKKAYALMETGKQNENIGILKELISRFPFSDEATLARQKLKDIID